MRVVAVNKFHYLRGGAERYFFEVNDLLRRAGHEVHVFSMRDPRNEPSTDAAGFVSRVDFAPGAGAWEGLRGGARAVYSFEARRRLARLLRRVRPHVVHLHNIAHHLSPSVIDAAVAERVPRVQTQHDYKLVCPVYVLMRGGRVCEECRGGKLWNVLRHRCNRGSWARSAGSYAEAALHAARGTYRKVDVMICPSSFQRETLRRFGWPDARTAFVPHFVRTEGVEVSPGGPLTGGYLGRLSAEKGLDTLLEALRRASPRLPAGWEFLVAGDGPQRAGLESAAAGLPVRFLGPLAGEALDAFWRRVRFTVMPSVWYEVRPIALHEAFARGKSAVGSDLGSIPELVRPGLTGLLAPPGDVGGWAAALERAYAGPDEMLRMGREARRMAGAELTPERHLEALLAVYERARA
ncbi:MAG: glycosyltransferase family 4 protein [Candidatus Eisenbacteria bacterium]|nr:glycosyltransferase family 4 protein [Candidatus Eisenbacteria bacterium]